VTAGDLSAGVRQFIAQHVESAEQLDILLLLQREPDRSWTALDVSRAIYTVPASATMRLEHLAAAGFLESTGGSDPAYAYRPASEELRSQVAELASAYEKDRVGVIKLIFSRPADPVESFSEAFRLRGTRE
jgi:hypothetical protein